MSVLFDHSVIEGVCDRLHLPLVYSIHVMCCVLSINFGWTHEWAK